MAKSSFPSDFVWGAATASYQIEGAYNEDGRGESIWDRFSRTPGKVKNGDTGDVACDHYHRYREDVALMKKLGLQAYRFSVAWPRIVPDGRGASNAAGLDFYDRLVDELLAAQIEPYLTIYHWDLPQALQDRGGWDNRDTCGYYVDYATILLKKFGDRVKHWTTFNEPFVSAFLGNEYGIHAPGFTDRRLALQVAHNVLVAHGTALQAIRSLAPSVQASIVLDFAPPAPAKDTEENHAVTERMWQEGGTFFLDPLFRGQYSSFVQDEMDRLGISIQPGDLQLISQPLDFLGINFYRRLVFDEHGKEVRVEGAEYTAIGWEVYAEPFRHLLVERLNREYTLPPIYITENGASFVDTVGADGEIHDARRVNYLREHLSAIAEAIADGVDIRGYFVWSLLDNFEWSEGYSQRFGIVYVDYATQRRIIKDSGRWYAHVIAQNEID